MNLVTCYHCNYSEKIKDFITRERLIVSQHKFDDNWSGKGMYFWDNLGNAKYWKGEKLKREKEKEVWIISLDITFDSNTCSFLDLTDPEILKKIVEYYQLTHPDQEITDKKIGVVIDDYTSRYRVEVVKILGNYRYTKSPNIDVDISKLSFQAKTIYCVKENCEANVKFDTVKKVEEDI
ncbi:hypothetical protein SMU74_05243 [Streptococcus mutans M2A]|nr:hypothetical protein SMU74_05243 [Streptococcus mutans M2A]